MATSISKNKVFVGLGLLGLATATALTYFNKVSRTGLLALQGSSLACFSVGLISLKSHKRLTFKLIQPNAKTSFLDAQFDLGHQTMTGRDIIEKFGYKQALVVYTQFKFVPQIPTFELDQELETFKKKQVESKHLLTYERVNDKGEKTIIGLNEKALEQHIKTFNKEQKQAFAKEMHGINEIADKTTGAFTYVSSRCLYKKENKITMIRSPEFSIRYLLKNSFYQPRTK